MNNQKHFDVSKRQHYLFEASVRNTLLANESIKMAQESLLALGLAELAFLGVVLLGSDNRTGLVKTLIILLAISFLSFLFGQIIQFKKQLRTARRFEAKSNRAIEYISDGNVTLNYEPDDISVDKQQIKSSKAANYLIFSSLVITSAVTIISIWLVITL